MNKDENYWRHNVENIILFKFKKYANLQIDF